ncbi:two-component system chemotaxis response regulator CheY [Sedimentibacter acidaminivorans]|uniref:Two-component system chemotaxis response regulator CheY n=1 Tax=Sedimentibacter acidaminivorans TaxID=913099 RepID=A0ABS4GCD2_9FIRM|nr:response regulator [Sedimentibacter acidaminivorans]MBP1925349.1 two-component system chemotaxis response regulator CheY [Sedimentibacter acidaminivorans]
MQLNELKILICDDSILVRKKFKDIIVALGCDNIIEAVDGQQAIDIYKEQKPTLVFMDIVMPVKTGIEALSEIISYDLNAKVIIVSSIGTNNKLKEAIKIGAYDFFQKPIDEGQLKKIIMNYIDKENQI